MWGIAMGSMLISRCSCGFESTILNIGGGRMNFKEVCEIPFYCDKCEMVISVPIRNEEGIKENNHCPECRKPVKHYGEIREDNFEEGVGYIFDWKINEGKRYFLQDKPYYCPKCKKEEMRFDFMGCWD